MNSITGSQVSRFEPELRGCLLEAKPGFKWNLNHLVSISGQTLGFVDRTTINVSPEAVALAEQYLGQFQPQEKQPGMFDFPNQIGGLGEW